MKKLKMAIIVIIPAFFILSAVLFFYCRMELKQGTKNELYIIENNVRLYTENLSANNENVANQTNVLASMLSLETATGIDTLINETLEKNPDFQAIGIAYNPAFLKSVREGHHPEFSFPKFFGEAAQGPENDRYSYIKYRDASGTIAGGANVDNVYENKDWYLLPSLLLTGRWTNPFVTRSTHSWVAAYGLPFYHDNVLAGVVSCMMPIDRLTKTNIQEDVSNLGIHNTRYFIVNQDGRVVYHSQMDTWSKFSLYSIADEAGHADEYEQIDKMLERESGTVKVHFSNRFFGDDLKEETSWYVFSTMRSNLGWTVVAAVNENAINASLCGRLIRFCIVSFATTALICAAVLTLLFHYAKPLYVMIDVAEKVAAGNLDVDIEPRYTRQKNSISRLARTFNEMIVSLKSNIENVVLESSARARIEEEQDIAQEMQESFLPGNQLWFFPERNFVLQYHIQISPEASGDFYDFWHINDDVTAFLTADVAGKGAAAIMSLAACRTLIRQVSQKTSSPEETLTEVNRIMLMENRQGLFISLFLGFYSWKTGTIHYCNAGHVPPVILKKNGNLQPIGLAENTILGICHDLEFHGNSITLEEEDIFFLYTNGVPNEFSPEEELFGQERVASAILSTRNMTTDRIIPELARALDTFRDGTSLADDFIIFGLKRTVPYIEDEKDAWDCEEVFQSIYGNGDYIIDNMLQKMGELNWSDRDIFAVNMAMIEGINNAIEHGNELNESKRVYMKCKLTKNTVHIAIRDEGNGFQESAVPDPRQRRRLTCPTGRGILLIRNFMSKVWFNQVGNEVYMEKYRSELI
ncbi:MAG: SpoIIE family protein phosphatase [Planctomycetia bacterium]|nr:SpoIIE family protein phosphatase [Planctomycetia bacterium]